MRLFSLASSHLLQWLEGPCHLGWLLHPLLPSQPHPSLPSSASWGALGGLWLGAPTLPQADRREVLNMSRCWGGGGVRGQWQPEQRREEAKAKLCVAESSRDSHSTGNQLPPINRSPVQNPKGVRLFSCSSTLPSFLPTPCTSSSPRCPWGRKLPLLPMSQLLPRRMNPAPPALSTAVSPLWGVSRQTPALRSRDAGEGDAPLADRTDGLLAHMGSWPAAPKGYFSARHFSSGQRSL